MNTGELRWRLALQQVTPVVNAYGQPVKKTWSTVGTYWGKIETLTGREAVNARQIKAEVTHKLTLRYIPSGVSGLPLAKPDMRIVYKGRSFNILWLNNFDERNRTLILYAQEVVSL